MRNALILAALFAATSAACTTDTPADCNTDNPEYPDCLPEDDGGKADNASASLAQMNDLTIVMPLAGATTDAGFIPPTALLPKTTYTKRFPDHVGPTPIGSDTQMSYDKLRVVAIRFDPCFAQIGPITDPATCDNQIRVIFQSLRFSADGADAIDGAVHAFYRVARTDLVAAIKEVIALRKANGQTTAMGPLQPHPLLVDQGMTGAFSKGLATILGKYAKASNLIRFTHFMSGNLQTNWSFSGFDVAGTTTTEMVIPGLPADSTTVSFFEGFSHPMNGTFTPESIATDSITKLANVTKAKAAAASTKKKLYSAALRIENPNFHSPNTVDCASCHVGQAARLLIGDDVLGLSATDNVNLFKRDPKFVSARSMKQTTSVRGQSLNLHMLSYRNDALMIGQRVINETASVVAYVNGTLLQ